MEDTEKKKKRKSRRLDRTSNPPRCKRRSPTRGNKKELEERAVQGSTCPPGGSKTWDDLVPAKSELAVPRRTKWMGSRPEEKVGGQLEVSSPSRRVAYSHNEDQPASREVQPRRGNRG